MKTRPLCFPLIKKIRIRSSSGVTETNYENVLINNEIETSTFNLDPEFKNRLETKRTKNDKNGEDSRDIPSTNNKSQVTAKSEYLWYSFDTKLRLDLKHNPDALISNSIYWSIVDPDLYNREIRNEKKAQGRIRDILASAVKWALADREPKFEAGTEIDKETVKIIKRKCNVTFMRNNFGLKIIELRMTIEKGEK